MGRTGLRDEGTGTRPGRGCLSRLHVRLAKGTGTL
jgi:hypothetical protein